MANLLTVNFDYTYNGVESTDLFYKPSVLTPEITQLFTVKTGVKYKQQMPLVGILDKIVKKYAGCARTPNGDIDITNCTLEVKEVEFLVEQCKDAFEATIFGEELPDDIDASTLGAKIQGIMQTLVVDAVRRDNFRILSFGDVTSLSTDYDQLDGLWTKMVADSAAGQYCVTKVDAIGTGALAANAAIGYLQNLYTGAPIILKQIPNAMKKFYVTGSIYENLLASYESRTNGTERQFELLLMGPTGNLTYRGIEIICIYAWDNDLADTSNPHNGTLEHLILYTTPQNHFVGVGRDFDPVNRHYEWKDRKFYIEGLYRMGYIYCHCDLQAVSY